MKYFLIQKNSKKNKKGFTLVEVLVAIFIFSISILTIMAVLSSGIRDIESAKQKMVAEYLAQEGIEYMRNMRDSYIMATDGAYNTHGEYFFSGNTYGDEFGIPVECEFEDACYLAHPNISANFNNKASNPPIATCASAGNDITCAKLKTDGTVGFFDVSGSAVSPYKRTIQVVGLASGSHEVKVISTVTWGSKSVSFSENLFNWRDY